MWRKRDQFLCGVVEGFYGRPWTTEQRLDLFTRMSQWGMNTYLYAPKDDDKHRACWRELYSLEEADQISHLIHEASSRGIIFVYAIAPGLDITFSSSKEIELLKRKLDQVAALGCKSFAILFDDIDSDMCPADAKVFPSFAHAQVSTTNELFTHLDQPNVFLFCPTEYCATRAVPNVTESQYLKHIGSELHPKVDIMWTGPKVISKTIPLPSIKELSSVLQRPPVLWDNLHANDYDQRRLFLGPYSGRSVALLPHMNGVLTNPNCEYSANYVPVHTLAQWSRSATELVKRPSPTRQAFQLEVEGQTNELSTSGESETDAASRDFSAEAKKAESLVSSLELHLYEPKQALEVALREWIHEFRTSFRQPDHYQPVKSASSIAKANEFEGLGRMDGESVCDPDSDVNEQVNLQSDAKLESQGGAVLVSSDPFSYEDLKLLVDYFYLPHQHGERAMKVLEEFCWIKENAPGYESLRCMGKLKDEDGGRTKSEGGGCEKLPGDGMRSDGETSDPTEEERMSAQEVNEWCERCKTFHTLCDLVKDMYSRLSAIPNRPLLYDIYQYMWDAKETTLMLDSYVSWLEGGGSDVNSAHEPHLPQGGIIAEMQDLLPRVKQSGSLYRVQPPKEPNPQVFSVRPYRSEDKELVYQVCLETGDSGEDATSLFTNYPDLLGDRFVGPYITLNPDLSFVLEDSKGVCGYVLAALDSQGFYKSVVKDWLPRLSGKYPTLPPPAADHKYGAEEELLREVASPLFFLPPSLQRDYPSHLHIDLMLRAQGKGMGTSMIKTILAILKARGSPGVHLEMSARNKRALKFYLKRGFTVLEFEQDPQPPDDILILGREL